MAVNAWACTDVGRKRKINEDSFLVDPDLGLYVVADGMGGHAAGEVASARCVEIVRDHVRKHAAVLEPLGGDSPTVEQCEKAQQLLARAIERACAEIVGSPGTELEFAL